MLLEKMKSNKRRQPQRVPPPILSGNERIEGETILEELPNEAGMVLWKTFRSVRMWIDLESSERQELIDDQAHRARIAHIEAACGLDEIREPLITLAEMFSDGLHARTVGHRCQIIEAWATAKELPRTALEYGQLAALAAPTDAAAAVTVAKRGRDLGEFPRAESWYWQATVRARKKKDWPSYVVSALGLGITHRLKGNYPAARRSIERGLRRARRQGLVPHQAMAYHELAVLAMRTSNLGRTVEYGREAFRAYGPNHPRLRWLAHDLAVCWMNRGYFKLAYDVFDSLPSGEGSMVDRAAHAASFARASGALRMPQRFAVAKQETLDCLNDPTTTSIAPMVLLELARGEISMGNPEGAEAMTARAREMAQDLSQAEIIFEADALLGEIGSWVAVDRVRHVRPPEAVADLAEEIIETFRATSATAGV